MTDLLMSDGSVISLNNKNVSPITECKRCGSKNLKHDFSAGYMSDEYSNSECLDCSFNYGYCMGGWVGNFTEGEYTIWFHDNWAKHPVQHLRRLDGARIDRDGYKFIGEKDKDRIGSVPLTISMQDALALMNNSEELWRKVSQNQNDYHQ